MGVQLGGKVIWAGFRGCGCGAGTSGHQREAVTVPRPMMERRGADAAVRSCLQLDSRLTALVVSAGQALGLVMRPGGAAAFACGMPARPALAVLAWTGDRSPVWGCTTTSGDQVSDTLNPHERPFTGMLDRHPRPASGRGGCFSSSVSVLGGPPLTGPVLVVFGDDDRWRVAVTGAHGLLVRVIGQHCACLHAAGQSGLRCSPGRSAEPGPVARVRVRGVTGEEDGQGGQVRQDLILANVGVLRPGRIGDRGAGVAVPAPVRGPAIGPA